MRQLNLDIESHLDAQMSDFEGPGWTPIMDAVRQMHACLLSRMYLYGAAGTGKSHLLTAISESYLDRGMRAIQVSLLDLLDAPIEALASLEHYDLVALDDVETVAGHIQWQRAIFHLINYQSESGGQLVCSSRVAPTELKLELPDLQSRLAQAVSLKTPDGESLADRRALVEAVLRRRGLQFDDELVRFLIDEGPHKPSVLLKTIDQLTSLFHGEKKKLNLSARRQIYALIREQRGTI